MNTPISASVQGRDYPTAEAFSVAIGARLTLPSRSLLAGGKYIHSERGSDIKKRFERVSERNTTGAYLGPRTAQGV